MTDDEGEASAIRRCTRCDEPVPEGASVCPACGTLQPARRAAVPAAAAVPAPRPGGPLATTSTAAAPRAPSAPIDHRRRSPAKGIIAVVVVLAALGGGIAIAQRIDERDAAEQAEREATAADAVRGWCDDPRPWDGPGPIAPYVPGDGAVAFLQVPTPASALEASEPVVMQIAPTVTDDPLDLDDAASFVSLAVCVSQAGTSETDLACRYELTNKSELGDRETVPLVETSYRARIRALATAEVVATGTISSAADECPTDAYMVESGVSNPLTQAQVIEWAAAELASA